MGQIGRYEIVRQTGNHGLGALYQAFDPVMHRAVMIRIADGSSDQARQAILFDAKQLAHLDHPNIIKFLSCEEDDGRPYLVMERFEGKAIGGRLPPRVLVEALKSAAMALDHAHSKGLIHRNLTPESLLLNDDGDLKITGFEIARPAQYLGEDLDLLLDSIHYMSPELVRGDVLDARADQYSLGVIAWRAVTGTLPFSADSPITLLSKIAFEAPEMTGANGAVTRIFERVFAKAPADRFRSSLEFASSLEVALSHVDPVAVVMAPIRPLPPEERKSPLPWIVVAIVVVVFAAVAAIIFMRPPRDAVPAVKTAPAPEIVPAPPPVTAETPAKTKPKAVKKAAVAKDTTPETPKLKPIDPKVVHQ